MLDILEILGEVIVFACALALCLCLVRNGLVNF